MVGLARSGDCMKFKLRSRAMTSSRSAAPLGFFVAITKPPFNEALPVFTDDDWEDSEVTVTVRSGGGS